MHAIHENTSQCSVMASVPFGLPHLHVLTLHVLHAATAAAMLTAAARPVVLPTSCCGMC
jgi:hypothetical protein